MVKTLLVAGVALLVLALAAACGDDDGGGGGGGDIQVGILYPFTGDISHAGAGVGNGVTVALDDINGAGGPLGRQINDIREDTRSLSEGAIEGASKLINVDDVTAMMGPTSRTIFSVLERIQQAGMPHVIAVAGSGDLDTTLGTTSFRNFPSDTLVGAVLVKTAQDMGFTEAGFVFDLGESAQGVKALVKKAWEDAGGTTTLDIDLAVDQPSYSSEALQVANESPPIIFSQMDPDTAAGFFPAVEAQGVLPDITFFFAGGADNDLFLEAVGDTFDEMKSITQRPSRVGQGKDIYDADFARLLPSEESGTFDPFARDALIVIALAIEAAGSTDKAAVVAAIPDVAGPGGEVCLTFATCVELIRDGTAIDFEGAANGMNFDETGNVTGSFNIVKWDGADWAIILELSEDDLAQFQAQN